MMISRRARALAYVWTLAAVAWSGTAAAQDTTASQGVRLSLIYTPGTKPGVIVLPVNTAAGDSIRAILQRDFQYGDRINVIALAESEMPPFSAGVKPNYPLFARLGAAALLEVTANSMGIQVAVHNAARATIERTRAFPLPMGANTAEWRFALHAVADEIEQWITGVRGISATRVLYVSGGRVWQTDSDGENNVALSGAVTAMSPVWHPKGTHIAYMTLGNAGSQIIIREAGGATRTLSTTPGGLNSTPAFSPDGNTLVYSHGAESGTDLYSTNAFGSEPARRITVGRGSDNTQPTFSPDGHRIAFTSSRLGHPEVYISDADGTNAELLTDNVGDQLYRANPDWSPDGRLVAFESQIAGRFQIMTIGLRDRAMKRYTSEGVNEQPSWAPDSRHLVFTSNRGGTRQLWVLDIESSSVRQLTHAPAGARFGAWSPLLLRPR